MHTRLGTGAGRACVLLIFLASTLACSFSLTGLGPTPTSAQTTVASAAAPATAGAKTLAAPPGKTPSLQPTAACTMPDLRGLDANQVASAIKGFKGKIITLQAPSDQGSIGAVVAQDPPAGTSLPGCSGAVTVTIGQGLLNTPTLPATATSKPSATPTLKPTLAPSATQSGPTTSLSGGIGPYTTLVYSDEFAPRQNGFTSGWKVKPGACPIQAANGFLEVCGKVEAFVGDNTWTDYKVTLGGLTVGASVSELSIFVRYQDANNTVKLLCNEKPAGAKTWLNCEFHSVLDGADSVLKGGSVPQVCDETCTLAVGVQGNKASLYLMDQVLATVTLPGPDSGGAGFRVNAPNHTWKLDDFSVYQPGYGARMGKTLFKDTFSNLFTAQSFDGQYVTTKETMAGAYKVNAVAKQDGVYFFHYAKPSLALPDHFYYTLTTRLDSASPTAAAGALFRVQDSHNFYDVLIDNQGEYLVEAYIDDQWETIIDWTRSDLILPGQANQVGILGEGADFSLEINYHEVDSFKDDRLKNGTFGVLGALDKTGDQSTVDFSDLEVYSQ